MREIALREPIDRTAAAVTCKGVSFTCKLQRDSFISKTPLPLKSIARNNSLDPNFKDFTGLKVGSLTVLGLSRYQKKRWVVKCICGNYTVRRAKSLSNDLSSNKCAECQYIDYIKWRYNNK